MTRLVALIAGCVLALTPAALAQPYDSPQALLEAFYRPYLVGDFPDDQSAFRSQALQTLYDADEANTPIGEMGALDFDPYVDGQDYQISAFSIDSVAIDGDTASADVSFENFGLPRSLHYDLVQEDGGWKIDDLTSEGDDYRYRLTEIFALSPWN